MNSRICVLKAASWYPFIHYSVVLHFMCADMSINYVYSMIKVIMRLFVYRHAYID